MPANGIIQGMRPLIGYNYGAGEHRRVEQLYRLTLLLNICIMTAGMILCLTIPGKLMGAFAENPQTIQNGFFGAAGVWHAFWVTEALSAVFAVIIYRRSVKAESFIEAE